MNRQDGQDILYLAYPANRCLNIINSGFCKTYIFKIIDQCLTFLRVNQGLTPSVVAMMVSVPSGYNNQLTDNLNFSVNHNKLT